MPLLPNNKDNIIPYLVALMAASSFPNPTLLVVFIRLPVLTVSIILDNIAGIPKQIMSRIRSISMLLTDLNLEPIYLPVIYAMGGYISVKIRAEAVIVLPAKSHAKV